MGNKWIEELPVGAKFREIPNEDYDYADVTVTYTKVADGVLYHTSEFPNETLKFPFALFGATEEFVEVVNG